MNGFADLRALVTGVARLPASGWRRPTALAARGCRGRRYSTAWTTDLTGFVYVKADIGRDDEVRAAAEDATVQLGKGSTTW